jgi:hypothetical protein
MTNIVSVADNVSTFTLANGSQAGRGVVVVASVFAAGYGLASATFNSSAATANRVSPSSSGSQSAMISYFDNDTLPAAAGTYSVALNNTAGVVWSIFELSGWDGIAPGFADALLAGDSWTSPRSVPIAGTNADAVFFLAVNNDLGSGFSAVTGQTIETTGSRRAVISKLDPSSSGLIQFATNTYEKILYSAAAFNTIASGPDYTQRKNSSFDVTHGLGTITTATLYGAAITINTTGAGTVNLTDTSGITTSGVYNLVLGDGAATQTYTVQLNVIGLPVYTLNKDGAALGALTGIKAIVTATAELNGTELYSANNLTATAGVMDSGIYPDTGAVADVVTVSILTSAGDGITFSDALEQF